MDVRKEDEVVLSYEWTGKTVKEIAELIVLAALFQGIAKAAHNPFLYVLSVAVGFALAIKTFQSAEAIFSATVRKLPMGRWRLPVMIVLGLAIWFGITEMTQVAVEALRALTPHK